MADFLLVIVVLACIVYIVGRVVRGSHGARVNAMSPDEVAQSRQREYDFHMLLEYGYVNSQLFCPHCQSKGHVRAKPVVQKVGISGGKATAAVLTLGASMLATGLSRKQSFTQAHCDNCNSTWLF
jgi:hypothetical protein